MPSPKFLVLLAAAGMLAGCNMSNDSQRAVAGGLGGALIADVLDTNVAAGAAIGALGGAMCDDAGVCR
ncbi:hypothetical protein DSD19_02445 [Rhodovulum sp. BSW8]|uniref:17 kDa surface antigen n=3 Tax=Rhodovulum TaxID=34008 RepID=A0A4R8FM47_9RHOB|nr:MULTISPECIES: hypothetical protein [Rhodovulum]OLS44201.1 hypothetical protein BV509_07535 [Rhodovulum sulfidophilum]MBL3570881.1 hypothetical protein [Rhodovulum visakhapatnamense]MBL3578832.1 hypothetical protein [Rhodovulum visakhapatnamense]PTW49786.1 hypothetical protein C8N38_10647 [Rhodovulum kholense]RAP41333.1 hypothetical protein BYZ73_10310 [Rhodovulum viride]